MAIEYKVTHDPTKTRVVVLKGGWAPERPVSLMSAKGIEAALQKAGYSVTSYDLTRDLQAFLSFLQKEKPAVVFNALHGPGGEDGQIQCVMDIVRQRYTHSGYIASAVGMHKDITKKVALQAGIRMPEGFLATWDEVRGKHPMEPPYVIKPEHEGSSLGVHIVHPGDDPVGAQVTSWDFEKEVLVEAYIPGKEIQAGIMNNQALPLIEVCPTVHAFYDFATKYTDNMAQHKIPADLPENIYRQAQDWALRIHMVLGCKGISRSDLRYDPTTNKLYFLEINTHPGCTPISLIPEAAAHVGITFENLCSWLIEDALCRDVEK